MRVPPHGMQDSRCLSDDDITALLEGQLVDAPLREAHAHLAECAACRTLWTTAAQARSASSLTMTPVASGAPLVEAAKTSLLPSGTNVGRFVVLRIVGSGGMGVVYSAYDPELDRKVALKFLRLHRSGSDETEQVLRQCLQREAKAMARIVHPSVITVYDIGTFASDVFIAMELVDGFTFSEWCAARPRRRDEILALLRKAGEGLAAAHRVGIIHRDFKPSNVLVSTRGEVRITDFGLARLVRQRDVSPSPGPEVPRPSVSSEMSSMLTSAAVGTPSYMAPEQFAGKKVDARADQWSFSVMLYEALHGTRPYVANSLGELAKKVQEGTVEVSDALPVEVRRTLLRGLQRDPAARFASMDELLATLTKDSRAARRRTLSWLGVGALAVVAVVAGYKPQRGAVAPCSGAERKLAGVWDAQQRGEMRAAFLRTARPFAQKAWTESERSLSVYAAGFVRSHTEVCEATRLRAEQSEQLMDLRLGCLELRRKDLAAVRDVFLHADGQVVEGAQRIVAAMPSLDSCSNTQELLTAPPPTDPMLRARMADLETALAQIRVRSNAGQYQQGLEHMNVRLPQVLELGQRRLSAEYQRTLGRLLEGSSRYGDAEKSYYDALFDAEAAHSDTLAAEIRLRILWLIRMWRPQDPHLALLGRETVAAVARAGDPPTLLAAYYDVEGIGHDMLGDNAAARSSMERALALYERARGLESLEAANTLNNLAYVYHKLGRWDDALVGLRRALTIADKLVGPAHPFSAKIRHHIGTNLSLMGRPAEALPMLQAAVKVHESSDSAPNEQTARLLGSLGITFALLGRYDEARNLILRELQIADSLLGKEHPANGAARRNLAEVLERQGRLVEAGARFEEALRISQKAYGAEHTDVALAYVGLARIKGESGHAAAALSDYRQAQAIFVRLQKQPDQDAIEAQLGVGASLATLNRHAEALPILESALAAMPTGKTPLNDRLRGRILSALARVLWAMSRPGDQGRAMEHAQSARRLLTPLPMAKAELTLVQTWLALRGQP